MSKKNLIEEELWDHYSGLLNPSWYECKKELKDSDLCNINSNNETPPDLVVWNKDTGYDANIKNYPTSLSAPKFELPNVGLVKTEASKKMIDVFNKEKDDIVAMIHQLQNEYTNSIMVWESKMSFEPIVGHTYYLYDFNGINTLSLLSPNDWDKSDKLIGSFTLNFDRKWIKCK